MKRLLAVIMLAVPLAVRAQKADERVGKLLGEGDYFALGKELPALKGRMTNPVLGCLADGLLGSMFNRPAEAVAAFDSLLTFYPEALAPGSRADMEAMRGVNLMMLKRYGEAADKTAGFLEGAENPEDYMFSCGFVLRASEALRERPVGRLERPAESVRVPFRAQESGRGEAMLVPATVDGRPCEFIFDTGCAFFNFVTERFASENGLEIVADSIPITGMGTGFVKLGMADSLSVGALTYRNPVFLVAPDDSLTNLALPTGAVLGTDFLQAAGTIVFRPAEGTVEFPVKKVGPAGEDPNMYMTSGQLYAEVTFRGRPLTMHFDTGNVKSNFYSSFYDRFGRWVRRHGEKDETQYGGYGGIRTLTVYRLPEVALGLAGHEFELTGTEVVLEWDGFSEGSASGSLGYDFVGTFDSLTLDYDNMRLEGGGTGI